jgi:hypothetical protein
MDTTGMYLVSVVSRPGDKWCVALAQENDPPCIFIACRDEFSARALYRSFVLCAQTIAIDAARGLPK